MEAIGRLIEAQSADDPHQESAAIVAIVSPHATFRRSDSLLPVFLNRIAWGATACWHWIGSRSDIGYGVLAAARNYGCPEMMAHRIAWHLWYGAIPKEIKVLHRCDVRSCVNPEHLFLGTQADNVADMMAKGRHRVTPQNGEANPMARLTLQKVRSMRMEWATGKFSQHEIARRYGVSVMTVNRAVRRISWKTEEQ